MLPLMSGAGERAAPLRGGGGGTGPRMLCDEGHRGQQHVIRRLTYIYGGFRGGW